MSNKRSIFVVFSVLLFVAMISGNASAQPLNAVVGTSFTYQGKLNVGGSPANGSYDLQFALYNALSGGSQVGSTITDTNVNVTAGLFTVQLDFGSVFDGTALYLQIGVRPGGSSGAFTTLTPRQALTATPYAVYSTQAANANLLNSQNAAYYQNASNINSGTLGNNFYNAYANLSAAGYLSDAANDLALNDGNLQPTLNADLLDGLHASSFALAGHNHWGETWSGSSTGLKLNSDPNGDLTGGNSGLVASGPYAGVIGVASGPVGYIGVEAEGGEGVYAISIHPNGNAIVAQAYSPTNSAGLFQGNVSITGNLTVSGTKSAVVNTKDYGTRTLYAVESPQNWFEDFGTGQLVNGTAVITIEPIFAQTVNLTKDYHIFLTPNGDCALYVEAKTPTSFTVHAMGGGTCSIPFDYRIVAPRLGDENIRLAQVNTPPTSEPPSK